MASLHIYTPKELDAEVNKMLLIFLQRESEANWKSFDDNLVKMKTIAQDENCRTFDNMIPAIKKWKEPISNCLCSERTKLSGTACEVVEVFSERCSRTFPQFLELFVPPLLKVCSRTNKIAVNRATRVLEICFTNSKASVNIIRLLIENLKSQNKVMRTCVIVNMLIILQKHYNSPDNMECIVDLVEEILKIGLLDAESAVRENSRSIYEIFKSCFPVRSSSFCDQLPNNVKKSLSRATSASSSINRPKLKTMLKKVGSNTPTEDFVEIYTPKMPKNDLNQIVQEARKTSESDQRFGSDPISDNNSDISGDRKYATINSRARSGSEERHVSPQVSKYGTISNHSRSRSNERDTPKKIETSRPRSVNYDQDENKYSSIKKQSPVSDSRSVIDSNDKYATISGRHRSGSNENSPVQEFDKYGTFRARKTGSNFSPGNSRQRSSSNEHRSIMLDQPNNGNILNSQDKTNSFEIGSETRSRASSGPEKKLTMFERQKLESESRNLSDARSNSSIIGSQGSMRKMSPFERQRLENASKRAESGKSNPSTPQFKSSLDLGMENKFTSPTSLQNSFSPDSKMLDIGNLKDISTDKSSVTIRTLWRTMSSLTSSFSSKLESTYAMIRAMKLATTVEEQLILEQDLRDLIPNVTSSVVTFVESCLDASIESSFERWEFLAVVISQLIPLFFRFTNNSSESEMESEIPLIDQNVIFLAVLRTRILATKEEKSTKHDTQLVSLFPILDSFFDTILSMDGVKTVFLDTFSNSLIHFIEWMDSDGTKLWTIKRESVVCSYWQKAICSRLDSPAVDTAKHIIKNLFGAKLENVLNSIFLIPSVHLHVDRMIIGKWTAKELSGPILNFQKKSNDLIENNLIDIFRALQTIFPTRLQAFLRCKFQTRSLFPRLKDDLKRDTNKHQDVSMDISYDTNGIDLGANVGMDASFLNVEMLSFSDLGSSDSVHNDNGKSNHGNIGNDLKNFPMDVDSILEGLEEDDIMDWAAERQNITPRGNSQPVGTIMSRGYGVTPFMSKTFSRKAQQVQMSGLKQNRLNDSLDGGLCFSQFSSPVSNSKRPDSVDNHQLIEFDKKMSAILTKLQNSAIDGPNSFPDYSKVFKKLFKCSKEYVENGIEFHEAEDENQNSRKQTQTIWWKSEFQTKVLVVMLDFLKRSLHNAYSHPSFETAVIVLKHWIINHPILFGGPEIEKQVVDILVRIKSYGIPQGNAPGQVWNDQFLVCEIAWDAIRYSILNFNVTNLSNGFVTSLTQIFRSQDKSLATSASVGVIFQILALIIQYHHSRLIPPTIKFQNNPDFPPNSVSPAEHYIVIPLLMTTEVFSHFAVHSPLIGTRKSCFDFLLACWRVMGDSFIDIYLSNSNSSHLKSRHCEGNIIIKENSSDMKQSTRLYVFPRPCLTLFRVLLEQEKKKMQENETFEF